MAKYRTALPQLSDGIFLSYVGMETDLIFNRGIDLPGFASFPLLESVEGREILRNYLADQINLAKQTGVGVLLESPTWMANRDRGATIGYTPERISTLNDEAIKLMAKVRDQHGDLPTILSAQVGPRGDAYAPANQMNATEAENYHAEQIQVFSGTDADLISAFTLCYAEEAVGIVRASRRYDMPVAVSFTVETNGCLPTGMTLRDAIENVDEATNAGASYFLINCAHPDHFSHILSNEPWMNRLRGVIVNASRCSHEELDEAEQLDDGYPKELGAQLGSLHKSFPHFSIFGGCCGTDMRHMKHIASAVA
jgi:S-methylmethionine-dependent homocysteine/selenocysteine methylase